jgi:hypothetical protein
MGKKVRIKMGTGQSWFFSMDLDYCFQLPINSFHIKHELRIACCNV